MIDLTNGKLDKALKFAKSQKDDSLQKCLHTINCMEDTYKKQGQEVVTRIIPDYYPYSFIFVRFEKRTERFITNGLILYQGEVQGKPIHPVLGLNFEPASGWKIIS